MASLPTAMTSSNVRDWLRVAILALMIGFPLAHLLGGRADSQLVAESVPTPHAKILLNSTVYAAGSSLVALTLALPIGIALARLRLPMRPVLLGLVVATAAMPLYIYAAGWMGIFDATPGGEVARGWPPAGGGVRALPMAVWINGCAKMPIGILLTLICLWGQNAEEEEAAWLDTGRMGVLVRVILRHAVEGMLVAGCSILCLALSEIAVTDMLSIRTLAEEVYIGYQLTMDSRRSMVMIVAAFLPVVVGLIIPLAHAIPKVLISHDISTQHASRVFQNLPGLFRWATATFIGMVLLALNIVPLLALLSRMPPVGALAGKILSIGPELALSCMTALAASILAVALAFPLVTALRNARATNALTVLAVAGLFVPGCVTGIGLVHLFNRPGLLGLFYDSHGILVLAQAIRVLPIAVLLLSAFTRVYSTALRDMADVDGAAWYQELLWVRIPVLWRPMALTCLICMVWCVGELDASLIVCPPGTTTLPIRIFTMMHYGIYGDVAMACLLLSCLIVAIAGLLWVVWRRRATPRHTQ